jgi:hypothetical protein
MNATPHTALGYTSLKLIGVNPIGCVIAVITHFIFDYVGEKGIVSTKDRVIYDFLPTVISFIVVYFTSGISEVGVLLLGSILGNLPDLIDKKLYLTIFFPSKFKMTNYLHWQKTIINPTEKQTKIIGYVSGFLIPLIYIMQQSLCKKIYLKMLIL